MRTQAGLIRAARYRLDETRCHLARVETTIAEFEALAAALDAQIRTEEDRSGQHDPEYFAYPTFARAARQRREKLEASIASLKGELGRVRLVLSAAEEEANRLAERSSRPEVITVEERSEEEDGQGEAKSEADPPVGGKDAPPATGEWSD